ncbi:MAG: hypothetical protein IGS03_15285 [Candidatus Sericytochromatia bacterium]|nr:hypothetical protein [Candidatus Sericytochromatia bacterium]
MLWVLGCLLLGACAQNKAYTLAAEIQPDGTAIVVKGSTNLPDKALILVSWLQPAKDQQPEEIVVQEFALAEAGSFEARLEPLQPVAPGPYQLRMRFSAGSYDPSGGSVKAEVGERGENLGGPLVVEDADGRMLLNLIDWNYQP